MCKPTDPSSTTTTTTTTATTSTPEPSLTAVGFLGAGMMATAIMDGLIDKQVVKGPASIACSDVFQPVVDRAAAKGYKASSNNADVCQHVAKAAATASSSGGAGSSSALLIAVKPHIVPAVCADIMTAIESSSSSSKTTTRNDSSPLIISVAAGVTLDTLQTALPGRRVVRVMPNTPCAVGESATGYCLGRHCTDHDRTTVQAIFGSVGLALEMAEHLLNAVTGVSGSGPAYVFNFIQALADGGVRVGLPRADALRLAAQTVRGAATMVLQNGSHPAVLQDAVCSPGGTTIAGVEQLELGGMRAAVMNAVKAATRRSMQLGGVSEEEICRKSNL